MVLSMLNINFLKVINMPSINSPGMLSTLTFIKFKLVNSFAYHLSMCIGVCLCAYVQVWV